MAEADDPTKQPLPTPEKCVADFCLIPLGTSTPSVSHEIAEVQRLLQKTNLTYSMHSAGTTIEGPWDEVMKVIGQAHSLLHGKGILRVQTDIRVGSRTDKQQTFREKVMAVEKILADEDQK
ncbi:MAG: hypothetical protein M1816_002662 [Peltula sp. TS41687]|nr:MAG: hypothetical protein M1816_002662 [Peltula sp. TS41687]